MLSRDNFSASKGAACEIKEPDTQKHIYVKMGNGNASQPAVSFSTQMNGTHIYF